MAIKEGGSRAILGKDVMYEGKDYDKDDDVCLHLLIIFYSQGPDEIGQ